MAKTPPKATAKAEPDWDARYSKAWNFGDVRRRIHAKTGRRCCWCHVARSEECHHGEYQNPLFGQTRNNEVACAGVSIFPVCKRCHKVLHKPENWRYDKADVVFGSGNTKEVLRRLRQGFKMLSR